MTLRHLLAATVILLAGCAGSQRQLHPTGGDGFTLFPGDQGPPTPIVCSGDTAQRLACFTDAVTARARTLGLGGALTVATADGASHNIVLPDERNPGITLHTRFPAASVTKMFLAMAIVAVALQQESRLDLQAPIASYLPELAGRELGQVTLHQLLTHTAGIGEVHEQPATCDEALVAPLDAPMWAPPGAVYRYSNLGYSLAAVVLERVTGQRFEDVVRERVLIPAGIPEAGFGPDALGLKGRAPDGVVVVPHCRATWPAGGLVLSAPDLAHFAFVMAQPSASQLDPRVVELVTAPYVLTGGQRGESYGYGVARLERDGVTFLNHSGAHQTFSSFVVWSPEKHIGVATFATSGGAWPSGASLRALSIALDISQDWRPPAATARPLWAYTGDYFDARGGLGHLRVGLEDGVLVVDYPEGAPPLLSGTFNFVFAAGEERARYVVTQVGVGERR